MVRLSCSRSSSPSEPAARWLVFFCLAILLLSTGCSTVSGPASASFASVSIRDASPEQIHNATEKVFTDDGYVATKLGGGLWVFDKEASRLTTLSREGPVATQEGARTIERVR